MKIRIGEEPQEISSNICNIFPLLIPLISAGVSAIGSGVKAAMSGGDEEQKKQAPGTPQSQSGLQGSNMVKPVDVQAKAPDVSIPPPQAAPPPIMTPGGSGLGGSISPAQPTLPSMGGMPKPEEEKYG